MSALQWGRGSHPLPIEVTPMTFLLFAGTFAGVLYLLLRDFRKQFPKY